MSRSAPRARRLAGIEPFLAMEVLERALEIEAAGARVLHLEVGEPDLPAPEPVVEACVRALREGQTHYTDSRGLVELREAIAADLGRRFDLPAQRSVDPAHVIVTSGTSPAMLLCFEALLDPGDEVVIPTPHYPCYPNFVRLCGGVPVFVETHAHDGYRIDVDSVRAALSPRTRAIVVASPANPTGAIQSRETLAGLAALGPPLVCDEIYDQIVYDGARVCSALEVAPRDGPSAPFVLDGFSKRYAMTGFRLGWVVAPPWAARSLQVLQQSLFISASSFVQRAGIAALSQGEATLRANVQVWGARRRRMVDGLRALGFGVSRLPQGAFYVLADARRFGADSRALAFALLEGAGVGAAPGIDFGAAAEGWLRFCYAVSDDVIDEALARIAQALPALEERARANAAP